MATELHPRRQIPSRAPKKPLPSGLSDPKPNPNKPAPSPSKPPPACIGFGYDKYLVSIGRSSASGGTGAFLPGSKAPQNQQLNPVPVPAPAQPQVGNGSGSQLRDTGKGSGTQMRDEGKGLANPVPVTVPTPFRLSGSVTGTGVFLPRIPASTTANTDSKKTPVTTMYVEKQKKKAERKKKQVVMEVSPDLLLPAEWTY